MPEPRPSRISLSRRFGPEPTTAPGEALPWPEVERWLHEATQVWIVTVRPDGRPHAVPVDILWLEGVIYFGAPPQARRGQNLARNPELALHGPKKDHVLILEGTAERLQPSQNIDRLAQAMHAQSGYRWSADELFATTWSIRPRRAISWSRDMRNTATRWEFA